MEKYPKIQSIFKRDENGKFIDGNFSLPEFEYLKDNLWLWTEKIDGMNIRVYFDHVMKAVKFFGRNDNANIPKNLIERLEEYFPVEKFKELYPETSMILYGEGYGCFSSNTGILLADGTTEYISSIVNKKLKVKILTYNFKEKKLEKSDILNYFKYPNEELIKIELEKTHKGGRGRFNQIVCTKNHLIYTTQGYKKAEDLIIEDTIMSLQKGLSFIQEQVLLGTLMGDGTVGRKYEFSVTHSKKQSEYIDLLEKIFGNVHISKTFMKSGYGSDMIRLMISNRELLEDIVSVCCVDNKKKINNKWMDRLTPIALAFWYMDDGSIDNCHRRKQVARLATQGFSIDELELLQSKLFLKYKIKGNLKRSSKSKIQYYIQFSTNESEIFFTLISPYIIDSMKYKLPKHFKNMPCIFDYTETFLHESKVLKSVKIKNITAPTNLKIKSDYVYDLETKNQNYFIGSGFLVHNSGIQKIGKNYIPDGVSFILFDVMIEKFWLTKNNVDDIADKLKIDVVKMILLGPILKAIERIKSGVKSTFGDFLAEGLVGTPAIPLIRRNGTRLLTKIKHKDYGVTL